MKIRYKTWYWGKFVIAGTKLDGSIVTAQTDGFEPYIESVHGWQHSDEAKGQTELCNAYAAHLMAKIKQDRK